MGGEVIEFHEELQQIKEEVKTQEEKVEEVAPPLPANPGIPFGAFKQSQKRVRLTLHHGKTVEGRILEVGAYDIFLDTAQGMFNLLKAEITDAEEI